MSPELKLILMVSGSALKFHLNNTLLSQKGELESELNRFKTLLAEKEEQLMQIKSE